MHEYGIGFSEIRGWTLGQLFLFLRRMTDRYERQSKARKRKGKREMNEDDLARMGLMNG